MLYPVLHRLEAQGLVEARWGRSPEGRRRKYYRATDAGRRRAARARAEWLAVTRLLEALGPEENGLDPEASLGIA